MRRESRRMKKELCERELGGCICDGGPVWRSLSRCILKQSGTGLGTRREGSGEDASLEELGVKELRGGMGERDFHSTSKPRCHKAKGSASCLVLAATAKRGARQAAPIAEVFRNVFCGSLWQHTVRCWPSLLIPRILGCCTIMAPGGSSVTTHASCSCEPRRETGGAPIAMPSSLTDPPSTIDSCTSTGSAPVGISPTARASDGVFRSYDPVTHPPPRPPDQQQRQPSHHPHLKLSGTH